TPARIVAWDCLRNPPCECSRVTRNSLSVSASTSAPASSGCTIATTSFIGRRLYPAPLGKPLGWSTEIGHFWRCAHGWRRASLRSPFATRHPSLGREAQELIDLAADVRGHRLLGTVAVDHYEAAGLGRDEAEVPLADALVEGAVVSVEAVPPCRRRPGGEARERD